MSDVAANEAISWFPAEVIEKQIANVLRAWGMEPDLVETTVAAMGYADRVGIDSHGISMMMMYEEGQQKGKLNLRARPRVVREGPATALVDADRGVGHPAGVIAMRLAIQKALEVGIGAVAVHNSHHFGAAGYYAALAPERGLIGLVASSTRDLSVIPTRGTAPVLGTNPLAFAAPGGRHRPFLLDMSTSTVAANKVKVYDLLRKPMPEGWVQDERGLPVTDSALGFDYVWKRPEGGLTPLGGTSIMGSHKGYGLSVMVQLLGSTLAGASFSPVRKRTQTGSQPDDIGHFFLAIDPRTFREEGAFEADVDTIIDELHGNPPVDQALPVLVAGDPEEIARRERAKTGIPIPRTLADKIRAICGRWNAEYLLG
jgi:LDH2 family malate/lactate/ureidoglycolate dehydrogenase